MLLVAQIVLGVLVILFVTLQARGAGIGSIWGGAGEFYGTRRGIEKLLFRLTIIAAVLFIFVSLSRVFVFH